MPPEVLRNLGKLLVVFGVVLVVVGLFLSLGPRLPFRLGRLPGDIIIRRDNFTFYFPVVTCLLLSVVLSLLFWLWGRR
jgi:formate hydrogenlyase subunit 3/multisubunit Na+/H+ antiporter MnhD subunit